MSIVAAALTPSDFWQFTLGNVVTVVGGLIAWVVTMQKLNDRTEAQGKEIARHSEAIEKLTEMGILTTLQQQDRRITQLEAAFSVVSRLSADVDWIKRYLENERK